MENKIIKVEKCNTCPFLGEDTELDPWCNLDTRVYPTYEFKDTTIAEYCPLRTNNFLITLDETTD